MPTNPGRIYLPQETLGFRRAGFSPALSLLMPAFSLARAPPLLTVRLRRGLQRSPTTVVRQSAASVPSCIPDHLRRRPARPVSYYALFKWWLLLSQHPGCHRRTTSYRTRLGLGTLAGGLGCFRLDREDYPSRTHSRDSPVSIRSLVGACRRVAPRPLSVALPRTGSCPEAAPKGISKRTRYRPV